MKRVCSSVIRRSVRPLAVSLAVGLVACAAADDGDDPTAFELPPFGGGGAGQPPAGANGGSAATGAAGQAGLVPSNGAGGTGPVSGVSGEGNGGSLGLGAGGSTSAASGGSASIPTGGAAGASMAGDGTAGNGTAGNGSGEPPLSGDGPGRVGAELCPPGPFGNPIPANPQIQPLAAVDDNNFFILEGAIWVGDALYLSEIGQGNASQINRFTPPNNFERGVFPNTGSNGLALAPDGNLLLAAHDVGGISRLTLPGGAIVRGNQTRNGQRFNSPNDLVVRNDGNIYFTDPDFQSPGGRIQGGTFVYRIAPPLGAGEISVVEMGMDNPNGITLSPDGSRLYVAGGGTLREYALDAAGAPTVVGDIESNSSNGFNGPDGMGMDCAGNIYATLNGTGVVLVYSPSGERLGSIGNGAFGGQGVTNVAFGGPNRTTLFITTFSGNGNTGLFSVELNVPGLPY